jgi:hypothetical protein
MDNVVTKKVIDPIWVASQAVRQHIGKLTATCIKITRNIGILTTRQPGSQPSWPSTQLQAVRIQPYCTETRQSGLKPSSKVVAWKQGSQAARYSGS